MVIVLGNKVRDTITGFTGIAVSRVDYLTGCTQYGVVPRMGKDGKAPSAEYYDHTRLEVIGVGVKAKSADTGGPQRDAPRG